MQTCDNCGAKVPITWQGSDGRRYCFLHCAMHPLGCRCKYGEIGVKQEFAHYDAPFDYGNSDDCDWFDYSSKDITP